MVVSIGLGLMEFPFHTRTATGAGSICAKRVASIPCGRPIASSAAADPGMHDDDGRTRRPHAADQVRHERGVAGACAIRCCWPSSAPPSTCCPRGACCRPSASAARMAPNGRRSTSTRKTRGTPHRRGPRNNPPPVARGQRRFRRRTIMPPRCIDLAEADAARPADVDRRLVRRPQSGGPHASARAGSVVPKPPPKPHASSRRSAQRPQPPAGPSMTIISAPDFRSISARPTTPPTEPCSRLFAGVPAAIPPAISPSATLKPFSAGLPNM